MNKKCFDCKSDSNLHRHHVIPKSLGGTETVLLCEKCHGLAHSKNMNIGALTKKAMDRMRSEGKYVGGIPPYGFDLVNSELSPNEGEQEVLVLVAKYRKRGYTLKSIADELAKAGIKSRAGKPFAYQGIQKMLNKSEVVL